MKPHIQYADEKLLKIPHVVRRLDGDYAIYSMPLKIGRKHVTLEYFLDRLDGQLSAEGILDLRHEDDPNVNEMTDEAAAYMQAVAKGHSVVGEWYIGSVVMHRELLPSAEKAKSIEWPWKWMRCRLTQVAIAEKNSTTNHDLRKLCNDNQLLYDIVITLDKYDKGGTQSDAPGEYIAEARELLKIAPSIRSRAQLQKEVAKIHKRYFGFTVNPSVRYRALSKELAVILRI